jgi:hypothetical protein
LSSSSSTTLNCDRAEEGTATQAGVLKSISLLSRTLRGIGVRRLSLRRGLKSEFDEGVSMIDDLVGQLACHGEACLANSPDQKRENQCLLVASSITNIHNHDVSEIRQTAAL